MKKPLTQSQLEKLIMTSFQRKVAILFHEDGEYIKFMNQEIYPLMKVKIMTRYLKGDIEQKLLSELTEKDKTRFEYLKKLKYIHTKTEKESEKAIHTILRLIKDLHIFLAKSMELLVLLDIKTEDHESLLQKAHDMLYLYAPIAGSFGFYRIKMRMENAAFSYIYPKERHKIDELIAKNYPNLEEILEDNQKRLETYLQDKLQTNDVEVQGRIKSQYSIYKKMIHKENQTLIGITDLMALRVIVKSVRECYEVLGYVHSFYEPMPDRIKDYIVRSKQNGYRSLHTTVRLTNRMNLEIQIRTKEMHLEAEFGPQAHTFYKINGSIEIKSESKLKNILSFALNTPTLKEWSDFLESGLEDDYISTFTPKGDVVELPKYATPIDFAYSLHTDIGNHCIIALVDGHPVSLDTPLDTGQVVEIITRKTSTPNVFWLESVKTSLARQSIKRFLRKELKSSDIMSGKKILNTYLEELGKPPVDNSISILKTWRGRTLDFDERQNILQQIYNKAISARTLINEVYPETKVIKIKKTPKKISSKTSGVPHVIIDGEDSIFYQMAKCCNPKFQDKIIAYASFKGYIAIHKESCKNIIDLPKDHFKSAVWTE